MAKAFSCNRCGDWVLELAAGSKIKINAKIRLLCGHCANETAKELRNQDRQAVDALFRELDEKA